jgi:hypothetical protein
LCTNDWCDYLQGTCSFPPHCPRGACNTVRCDPADGSCHYMPANEGAMCLGSPDCVCRRGECLCSWFAFEVQP